MTTTTKFCHKCETQKPVTEFYEYPNDWGCRACVTAYQSARKRAKPCDLSPDEKRIAENFTAEASARDIRLLEFGDMIARQCIKAWCAIQCITHQWCARAGIAL